MSILRSVIYQCINDINEIIRKLWGAILFKFQQQKVQEDCLGPGFISISLQQYNKSFIYGRAYSKK